MQTHMWVSLRMTFGWEAFGADPFDLVAVVADMTG